MLFRSTGFTVKDIAETLYLSDVPNNDGETGIIFFFKLVDNSPFVVRNNAGIVNYKRGEIRLNPVIFTSSSSNLGIEIQAIPESNDVLALKDIYLELDTKKLNVAALEDVITSGENTSATQYAVTSSYLNGNYTR